jgi:hypothetical protein
MRALMLMMLILLMSCILKVNACKCFEQSFNESYRGATVIITGKVLVREPTAIKDTTGGGSYYKEMYAHCYLFLVEKVYKGRVISDTLRVYTGINAAACGWRFAIGQRYIVYGQGKNYFNSHLPKEKNTVWTSTCHRTMPFDKEEIAALKKMKQGKRRTIKESN